MLEQVKQFKFPKMLDTIIPILGVGMVVYGLIGIFLSPLEPLLHLNTHLTFALLLVLLPAMQAAVHKRSKLTILALSVLLAMAFLSVIYVFLFYEGLQIRIGLPTGPDFIIGIVLLIVVLECCRRSIGIALPLFSLAFLAYVLFGHYLPLPFYHPPISVERAISWFSINMTTGIYSHLLLISANVVFLFIMFGAILEITKAREFFTLVGTLVGQRVRGGPAQTAIVSSALVGSITGAASANVILTGVVTIPLMKRSGFRSEFAGAVEAVASSGGLLMPPVMGTVVFMMMSLTGFSYWEICIAAVIPALLYYLSAFISVYLYASKENIPPSKGKVDLKLMMRRAPLFIIPFGIIMALLALEYPVMYAAGWAMVVGIVLGFVAKGTRPSLKTLVDGLTRGAKTASAIAVLLALAGTFMATLSLTGMGPKVVSIVSDFSGGYLPAVLALAMFASLLLGCVEPMAGGYLIVALLVSPILVKMGVGLMQAHFFVLYFAVIGFLTPPAAPSPLVASGIAKSNFLKTALQAIRIAAPGYLIPFMFVYKPALLAQFSLSAGPLEVVVSIIAAILVVFIVGVLLFNYYLTRLGWLEIILIIASLAGLLAYFFTPSNTLWFMAGVACFAVLTLWQLKKRRDLKT